MPINVKNPKVFVALSVNAAATALDCVQPRLIRQAIAEAKAQRAHARGQTLDTDFGPRNFVRSLPAPAKRQRKPKVPTDV